LNLFEWEAAGSESWASESDEDDELRSPRVTSEAQPASKKRALNMSGMIDSTSETTNCSMPTPGKPTSAAQRAREMQLQEAADDTSQTVAQRGGAFSSAYESTASERWLAEQSVARAEKPVASGPGVGEKVDFQAARGRLMPATVIGVHPTDGAVELDIMPGKWFATAGAQSRIRRRSRGDEEASRQAQTMPDLRSQRPQQQQQQQQPGTMPSQQTMNPPMVPSQAPHQFQPVSRTGSRSVSAPPAPAQARLNQQQQDLPEASNLVRSKTACPKELFIPQREITDATDVPESPKTSALSKQLKVFKVGKWVEYNSDSLGGYIPAKVVALNPADSTVELDVKRGTWLSVTGPDAKVRKPKVRTDRSEWVFHL